MFNIIIFFNLDVLKQSQKNLALSYTFTLWKQCALHFFVAATWVELSNLADRKRLKIKIVRKRPFYLFCLKDLADEAELPCDPQSLNVAITLVLSKINRQ